MTEHGRIFIADGEEVSLHVNVNLLRREGYSCDGANDAVRALQQLRSETYDLLIVGLNMPGQVDLEFARLLSELTPGLPVILLTASPTLPPAIQSIRLPVVVHLSKPFGATELLGHVRSGLAQLCAYKMIDSMCQQAQAWSEDLQQLKSLPMRKAATSTVFSGELHLALSLHRVAKFLEDLQTSVNILARSGVVSSSCHDVCHDAALASHGLSATENGALRPQFTESPSLTSLQVEKSDQLQAPVLAVQKEYGLSAREWEVLSRLLRHQRVPIIAKCLFLSPHTVRNHLKAIFRKVGVHSQGELLERLTRPRV